MSFKSAAEAILRKSKRPLSPREIYSLAICDGILTSGGRTPDYTMGAVIYSDIKKKGTKSIFEKVSRGKFRLKSKSSYAGKKSFKKAAYRILTAKNRPMKCEEITDMAIKKGLIITKGKTPEYTMASQLYTDVKNRSSPFIQLGKNLFGLREWDLSIMQREIYSEERRKLKLEANVDKKRPIVGDQIHVDGLTYGPINENGVIFLFAKLQRKTDIIIESIQASFPDAKGKRKTKKGLVGGSEGAAGNPCPVPAPETASAVG